MEAFRGPILKNIFIIPGSSAKSQKGATDGDENYGKIGSTLSLTNLHIIIGPQVFKVQIQNKSLVTVEVRVCVRGGHQWTTPPLSVVNFEKNLWDTNYMMKKWNLLKI